MVNIIEAGKSLKRQSMEKLIADLKTYTLRNELSVLVQRAWFLMTTAAGIFVKIFGKTIDVYQVFDLEARHEKVLNELTEMDNKALYATLISQLTKSISIPVRYRKNDDVLSAYLVKFASKSFKRRLIDGLSISEKVEYILEKYPHMKVRDERKILIGWLWVSVVLSLLCLGLWIFMPIKKWNCFVIGLVLEILFTLWILNKMRIRWAIRYVWIARTEYGKKLIEAKLALKELGDQKEKEARENLKLLHTYLWFLKVEKGSLEQLKIEKKDDEKKYEKNLKRLTELKEKGDSDAYHMIRNLKAENTDLEEKKEALQIKILETEKNISSITGTAVSENKSCVDFYLDVWSKYERILVKQDVCVKMLDALCFEDLVKVEQRIYELNYASDPLAIAEHKSGRYYLSFRAEQGDIAKLYLEGERNDGKIVINAFEREDELKIVPLTREDMVKIVERKKDSTEVSEGEVLKYMEQIEFLSAETRRLRDEKYAAELKLKSQLNEIADMTVRLEDDAKKLGQLEEEIKKVSSDKEQAEKLVEEYEKRQVEFMRLSDELDAKRKELLHIQKKCSELTIKLKEETESFNSMQKELEERNKVLEDNITSLESSLRIQTQIANEARAKKQTDAQAIKKLDETIENLRHNLKKSTADCNRLQSVKEEYLKKKREDEKLLAQYKKQLDAAREEAEKAVEAMKEARKIGSADKYQSICEKVKSRFPHLSESEVIFFTTAEQFYSAFKDNAMVDYSVIIVEYCKVLEHSLWNYLDKSKEYRQEVKVTLEAKYGKTLGSAAHITAQDKGKSLGNYNETFFKFAKVRNDGAHKGVLGKMKTDEIKTFLWESDVLTLLTEN